MATIEIILLVIFMIVAAFLPSCLFAYVGWKLSLKIRSQFLRTIIKAGIISIAFAPTIYGHAGPMFAVWVIFLGNGITRLSYGLLPIIITWFIITACALIRQGIKNRRVVQIKSA